MVVRIALGLSLAMLLVVTPRPAAARDDAPAPAPAPAPNPAPAAIPGEDWPEPFVPRSPRTAEDRRQIDTILDYVAGRSQETRRDLRAAIALYEHALEKAPDSGPILRRLARIEFILGRNDEAVRHAQKSLELEPGDPVMLSLVLETFFRREDAAGAEAMLQKALANPKLDRHTTAFLLIERSLGDLYAGRLNQLNKAADAFTLVVDGLDDKAAKTLAPSDLRWILGADESEAYARFGAVFFETKRYDLAIKAFKRGIAYDPEAEHPDLPRLLASTQLAAGRPAEALETLEAFLRRQPLGREPYELLIEILDALKRGDEIIPRLEAAARNAPNNAPLQYLLAERYREAGQRAKADALYRHLLATQPDPRGFGALSASLLKEKKAAELVTLLGEAFAKPETLEVVKPQIESIINDPEFAEQLLAEGLKLQQAEPPRLSRESRLVLAYIATKSKKLDAFIPIQRLALKQEPNPQAYREFWLDLYRGAKYEEAANTLTDMLTRFPAERNMPTLVALAQSRALAGQFEPALTTIEEALKLNPNDQDATRDAMRLKGFVLSRMGRNDEAIAHYKAMLERYPNQDEIIKLARSGLSIIYVNLEQFDKGEEELELLLQRDPDDAGVNNDLGYLYADRGKNLEKAEAMIRKAIAADPENTAYLDSLGWVLYRRGKLQEAVEPLEKAVKDDTVDATIHDHLGDVYFKLQKLDKARAQWLAAEKIAANARPPDKKLADIRGKLASLDKLDRALTEPPGDRPKP